MQYSRIVVSLGLTFLVPLLGFGESRSVVTLPIMSGPIIVDEPEEPIRMCQSYRRRAGKLVKAGAPRPCRRPRNLRLTSNLVGGAALPQ